jgi:hypothetical protein
MTGGRLTKGMNDTTVGYARARRDLGCRYTIGFYDHRPEEDKRHTLRVESRRAGVHLVYPERYSFPSQKRRQELKLEAAYLVPNQFEGGGLRAHLFPLQPADAKTWNAILAVDFPVPLAPDDETATREFGAVLLRGTEPVHTFQRSISLKRPEDEAGASPSTKAPRVTFIEPVTLKPGSYSLTAVMSDPKGDTPYGKAVSLVLPDIPKREAILTGPILGRRRGDDVVVYGSGDASGPKGDRVGARDAFRPLLVDAVDRTEPLAALTSVCVVRPKKKDGPWRLHRELATDSGAPAGVLADLTFAPEGKDRAQCGRFLDEVPVGAMKPGGYTFQAVLAAAGPELVTPDERKVPFLLKGAAPTP